MKNEFDANRVPALEKQIKDLEDKIHSHFGIVPASLWNELDRLQMQLLNSNKV